MSTTIIIVQSITIAWLLSLELRHHGLKDLAHDAIDEAHETVRAGYSEIQRVADKTRREFDGLLARARAKK